jgi:general secretion pathway protein B
MSLILDALRKSEHQRQRQAGPGLAVVPESQGAGRPATWLLALAALLLLNMLVLAAVLMTGRQAEPTAVAPAGPTAGAPAATAPPPQATPADRSRLAPVTLPARPPRDEVRPLTTEVAPPTTGTAPPRAQAGAATSAPGTTASPAPAPARTRDEGTADDARLPRFADLLMRGELNLPHMHIDIHVYSPVPAERFVFINMRKYAEREATQEGPRIERITRDGVVMDYQGQRFSLSRD